MRVAACLEAVRVQRLVPVVALIAVCGDDVDVPTALQNVVAAEAGNALSRREQCGGRIAVRHC